MVTSISFIVFLLDFTFSLTTENEHYKTQFKFGSLNVQSFENDEQKGTERESLASYIQAGFREIKIKQFARRIKRQLPEQLHRNSRCTKNFFDRHLRKGSCNHGVEGNIPYREELNRSGRRLGPNFTTITSRNVQGEIMRTRNTFIIHPYINPTEICNRLLVTIERNLNSKRKGRYNNWGITINFQNVEDGYRFKLVYLDGIVWADHWQLKSVHSCTCGTGQFELGFFLNYINNNPSITINHFGGFVGHIENKENCAF
ncbi:Hypothetical predicted protein [Mytilus galloprovincialis]|uniref:Uncharacterized protein n=1 Tax=Mytilus galloprovincialis TaxID=29158 RepID=A0A8B6FFT4_MYTGA|nr:Hypothetical predicted protein [Mytilus galloprovincialis]